MKKLSQIWRRMAGKRLGTIYTFTNISMVPTFIPGDRALVKYYKTSSTRPARFDVIILRLPKAEREDLKRIVGLPGEMVEIKRGNLMIDGGIIPEQYVTKEMPVDWSYQWILGAEEYIVLGDNRSAPGITDSRSYGPVHSDFLVGLVTRRIP